MNTITPIKCDVSTGKIYGLLIKTILLNIITLGLYTFWGYSDILKYITNSVSIKESRYSYHGTGKDLLIGFLKIMGAFILITVILGIITAGGTKIIGWHSDVYISIMTTLTVVATFSLLLYLLYRTSYYFIGQTSWRGVRYTLKGSAREFMVLALKVIFINIITLGVAAFHTVPKLYEYILNNVYFGNQSYRLKIRENPLFWANLISLILFIPTLGFSRVWYDVKFRHLICNHLEFLDLKFQNTATFKSLAKLYIGNIFIIVLTLGLGLPWAMVRSIRYDIETIEIVGNMDKARFLQMEAL